MTEKTIDKLLREIERENDVRILFAAESGSRAWGFQSADSDYDVRFVYAHPLEWYLRVSPQRDVIEVMGEGGLFDAAGWDIRKALWLFGKANQTMLEWFGSPIVYRDDERLRPALLSLLSRHFSTHKALLHYYYLALDRESNHISPQGIELKRYLYMLRALLACRWILAEGTPPPVPFERLVGSQVKDERMRKDIEALVRLKRQGKEHNKALVSDRLFSFAKQLTEEVTPYAKRPVEADALEAKALEEELDRLMYDTIINS
ncbi:MAG: nucleotidyltransferase domain-containing protein [Prevotellaceae bacterium]|nr:nucleotidyltransferase domain-containing protein [Prevotellaceae bacterium]